MQTQLYPEVFEKSEDKLRIAVSLRSNVAGSSDITLFIYQPFLCGEDYPSLVHTWDNKDDDIFDRL